MTGDGKQREAIRELASILQRSDIGGYATPWLQHDSAQARFCIEYGQLKPCARVCKKTMERETVYEVSVFFRGKVGEAGKIADIEHAKQLADLMLRQFGVILVNNQED